MQLLYVFSFTLALVFSLTLMPVLIRFSSVFGLVDNPKGNKRKLHAHPIPRSGGLAIVLVTAIILLCVWPLDSALSSFLVSALVISGFGLLDDIVELTPGQKLVGQALGVCLAMAGGMVITDVPFLEDSPRWFSHALTFLFVMGAINGVNFSDGMDGLAAGTTLLQLVLIFILAMEGGNGLVAVTALVICASLVAFLRFNTHPAAIFMGDTGSQFLGFTVAWLAISLSQSDASSVSTLLPLLVLGLPVLDILQVVPVRIKKQLPLPGPDKEHFHHQIAKLGFYQAEVVAIVYVLQVILLGGAFLLRFSPDRLVFSFFAVFAAVTLGALYVAHRTGWRYTSEHRLAQWVRRDPDCRAYTLPDRYAGKFHGGLVSALLLGSALLCTAMPDDVIYSALVLATGLLGVQLFSRNRYPLALGRLATYLAAVFSMYGLALSVPGETANLIIDGMFVLLAIALLIAILNTRKEQFWLTPQDLLVLFFIVLLAPHLPVPVAAGINSAELISRTAFLLYCCEYVVLAQGGRARRRLTVVAILSLFLLGIHLL